MQNNYFHILQWRNWLLLWVGTCWKWKCATTSLPSDLTGEFGLFPSSPYIGTCSWYLHRAHWATFSRSPNTDTITMIVGKTLILTMGTVTAAKNKKVAAESQSRSQSRVKLAIKSNTSQNTKFGMKLSPMVWGIYMLNLRAQHSLLTKIFTFKDMFRGYVHFISIHLHRKLCSGMSHHLWFNEINYIYFESSTQQ